MAGGLLITFEGIDGCGKTTQVQLLQEKLIVKKVLHLLVREPGGTAVGEKIREILLHKELSLTQETELLLYAAARAEVVRQVIRPALAQGKVVVCDRYIDSTTAYQGYGAGGDSPWIRSLNLWVTGGLQPRLTFLLDLTVEEAINRRGAGGDRIETKDPAFHRRVRSGYLKLAGREPGRIKILDATTDPEEQHRIIWGEVASLLQVY